ncbi:hypothetical protein AAHE18_20G129200 [Arachis hypogaea]
MNVVVYSWCPNHIRAEKEDCTTVANMKIDMKSKEKKIKVIKARREETNVKHYKKTWLTSKCRERQLVLSLTKYRAVRSLYLTESPATVMTTADACFVSWSTFYNIFFRQPK